MTMTAATPPWYSCKAAPGPRRHRDYEIPQLSALAREGFVVATVNHRDASSDPHDMFPAYLEDVKAAIRYLRANARQWHVDPDRLGIWGTSSGGNTSLLVGLTARRSAV